MAGYFQQRMSANQAEIFKAIALLGLPGEQTIIACSEDIYVFLEMPTSVLDETFFIESNNLLTNYISVETKAVITEYFKSKGLEVSESSLKGFDWDKLFSENPEFVEKLRADRERRTQKIDGLAKKIFGNNVLTGTEVLRALAVGRKAARDYLYIRDDGKIAGTPVTE